MARVGSSSTFAFSVALVASSLVGVGCGGGGGSGSGVAPASSATVSALPAARAAHTATLIPQTGEILIVGGLDVTGNPLTSTVLVTPTRVTPGPDLTEARTEHTATLLTNGQVLIAGGSSDAQGLNALASSEVYDPITQTFSAGPSLTAARMRHVASNFLNQTGEFVVLAGGAVATQGTQQVTLAGVATVEVIDVANGTSTPLAQGLNRARYDAQMVRLDTGNFLVVGGEGAQGAEVFSPSAGTFTLVNAIVDRSGSAVISRGREVLVAGGQSGVGLESTTEVYDSATNTFAQGVRLITPRRDATATVVGNEVVVVGGRTTTGAADAVERLAGAALGQAAVTAGNALSAGRWGHTAVAIPNTQQILVAGGFDSRGFPMASIEVMDLAAPPATPTGTTTGTTPGNPGAVSGVTGPGGVGAVAPGVTPGSGGGTTSGGTTSGSTTSGGTTSGGTTSSGSGSSSGGISGFLQSVFGAGSSGNILSTVVQAALAALSNNSGGGFSGFMQAFVQNLMSGLLGSGSSGSGGSGGLLSTLLSGLLGGGSGGGSSGSGGSGLSGVLSSLLGGLLGGSSSGSSGGSSGSGSGLSGVLSSLLGGLFGGSGSGSGSGSTAGGATSGAAPSIMGMTPGQGRVGDSVLISATNITAAVTVRFNGVQAAIQASNTSGTTTILTVTVPQGATTGAVTVETGGQTLPAGTFTVL